MATRPTQSNVSRPLSADVVQHLHHGREGQSETRGTQVVDRVFDILEAFATVGPELSVAAMSRALGLKYSTTHRLLEAMARRGVVYRDRASRQYRIGPHLRQLALASMSQMDLPRQVHPFLEELTSVTGETSHLAVLDDIWVLYLDKVESRIISSRPSHLGRRLPAHCTGVGKVLVAFLPEEQLDRFLDRELIPYTPNTITHPVRLREELATIRTQGFAVDNEEIEEGLVCVAAPVREGSDGAAAAISVGGPASRMRSAGIDAIARHVIRAADEISQMLGVSGALGVSEP